MPVETKTFVDLKKKWKADKKSMIKKFQAECESLKGEMKLLLSEISKTQQVPRRKANVSFDEDWREDCARTAIALANAADPVDNLGDERGPRLNPGDKIFLEAEWRDDVLPMVQKFCAMGLRRLGLPIALLKARKINYARLQYILNGIELAWATVSQDARFTEGEGGGKSWACKSACSFLDTLQNVATTPFRDVILKGSGVALIESLPAQLNLMAAYNRKTVVKSHYVMLGIYTYFEEDRPDLMYLYLYHCTKSNDYFIEKCNSLIHATLPKGNQITVERLTSGSIMAAIKHFEKTHWFGVKTLGATIEAEVKAEERRHETRPKPETKAGNVEWLREHLQLLDTLCLGIPIRVEGASESEIPPAEFQDDYSIKDLMTNFGSKQALVMTEKYERLMAKLADKDGTGGDDDEEDALDDEDVNDGDDGETNDLFEYLNNHPIGKKFKVVYLRCAIYACNVMTSPLTAAKKSQLVVQVCSLYPNKYQFLLKMEALNLRAETIEDKCSELKQFVGTSYFDPEEEEVEQAQQGWARQVTTPARQLVTCNGTKGLMNLQASSCFLNVSVQFILSMSEVRDFLRIDSLWSPTDEISRNVLIALANILVEMTGTIDATRDKSGINTITLYEACHEARSQLFTLPKQEDASTALNFLLDIMFSSGLESSIFESSLQSEVFTCNTCTNR
jgi:hypothetical protein